MLRLSLLPLLPLLLPLLRSSLPLLLLLLLLLFPQLLFLLSWWLGPRRLLRLLVPGLRLRSRFFAHSAALLPFQSTAPRLAPLASRSTTTPSLPFALASMRLVKPVAGCATFTSTTPQLKLQLQLQLPPTPTPPRLSPLPPRLPLQLPTPPLPPPPQLPLPPPKLAPISLSAAADVLGVQVGGDAKTSSSTTSFPAPHSSNSFTTALRL
mmetsp:Transcript_24480/g.44620  ORF Transcript_24480/g.44620 Transcript_24480/m.44620 type:complete len:209 (-) Transcript_24480:79-705(-)